MFYNIFIICEALQFTQNHFLTLCKLYIMPLSWATLVIKIMALEGCGVSPYPPLLWVWRHLYIFGEIFPVISDKMSKCQCLKLQLPQVRQALFSGS